MTTDEEYQVIEDNAGGLFLFFFDPTGRVILGIENIEHAEPGDLDRLRYQEAQTWDSQLDDPQAFYDEITSYEFEWDVVADQHGIYPGLMGRAAQRVFGIDTDFDPVSLRERLKKVVKWYVKFPTDFYAFDFYCDSEQEREARRIVRAMFGYDRLPVGTQVWRA